jgi:two-component system sensor histidine kinase DesK
LKEVRSAVSGYRAEDLRAELARARMALDAADVAFTAPAGSEIPLDLTPAEESALAFALREAVTNIVRHAGARSCQVRIEATGSGIRLEVADDGRGAAGVSGVHEGSGLTGMRERIAALGGTVERESGEGDIGGVGGGGGTRLAITLPRGAARPRPAPALTSAIALER